MRAAVRVLSTSLALLSTLSVFFIMLSISVDVFRRNVVGGSVPGLVEYNEIVLVGLVYLSMAYAQHSGAHISSEVVSRYLPYRVRHAVTAIGLAVVTLILCWLVYVAGSEAWTSFQSGEYRFGLARVPVWPARVTIPVGMGVLVVVLVLEIVDNVKEAIRGGEDVDIIQAKKLEGAV